MEALNSILIIVLGILVVIALVKILSAPIRLIFKLLINTVFGFAILFVVNLVGTAFGFSLEMNVMNALITGIFGIPGAIALIAAHFLL
mgnify:CR=1 FL=1